MSASNTNIEYIISPPKGLARFDLDEIWRYKDLLYVLAWRDVKVRYKQTVLGVLWAILQPLTTMIIFSVFFGRLAKVPSDNTPYPIFVYSGLLLWTYFSTAVTNASNSLIDNESIVKKVYFPRLILIISTAVTPLIDFAFSLVVLFILMAFYHYTPTFTGIVLIPVLLIFTLFSATGLGLFLSSINAKFRDVRYVLPFFIQILMFITPVIYPTSIIPAAYQWIVYLNPMTCIIGLARSSLLGTAIPSLPLILLSMIGSVVIFVLGLIYFRKTERFFADVL